MLDIRWRSAPGAQDIGSRAHERHGWTGSWEGSSSPPRAGGGQDLIGKRLVRRSPEGTVSGAIVEAEAYCGVGDPHRTPTAAAGRRATRCCGARPATPTSIRSTACISASTSFAARRATPRGLRARGSATGGGGPHGQEKGAGGHRERARRQLCNGRPSCASPSPSGGTSTASTCRAMSSTFWTGRPEEGWWSRPGWGWTTPRGRRMALAFPPGGRPLRQP
jgi:hypothetical protein